MRKFFLTLCISFVVLFTGCVSNGFEGTTTTDAKELNAQNMVNLRNLAKNEEYIQKVDGKLVLRLDNMVSLVDELDLAIQKEKVEEYNKGVVDGKKAAKDELIQDGYVILKIEDLKELGLWREE